MREFYSVRVCVYVTVYIIHLLPYILEYLQVDSLVPGSYTHLDVYKRQGVGC